MYPDHNAVAGLIVGGPRSNRPPDYFYLGDVANNNHTECAELCMQQDGCVVFALHLAEFQSTWANQCYGLSDQNTNLPTQANVYSGVKVC